MLLQENLGLQTALAATVETEVDTSSASATPPTTTQPQEVRITTVLTCNCDTLLPSGNCDATSSENVEQNNDACDLPLHCT